jgi:hypothetical protein
MRVTIHPDGSITVEDGPEIVVPGLSDFDNATLSILHTLAWAARRIGEAGNTAAANHLAVCQAIEQAREQGLH